MGALGSYHLGVFWTFSIGLSIFFVSKCPNDSLSVLSKDYISDNDNFWQYCDLHDELPSGDSNNGIL